ncbi:hypothetical protein HMPREF3121_01690 [Corynebacterium sp. HMSC11E11]|nr:hypothetical protein HMPREF3121_01690 [Corynebacterium sp. HMSC11E11]
MGAVSDARGEHCVGAQTWPTKGIREVCAFMVRKFSSAPKFPAAPAVRTPKFLSPSASARSFSWITGNRRSMCEPVMS